MSETICDAEMETKDESNRNYKSEELSNETFDKRYICQICKNPVKDLTLHNKNVHEGINGKNFGSIANFEEHVNSLHKGIEYKCHLCDMPFMHLRSLKKHVKLIHESLEFKCEACNDSFNSKQNLLRHVKTIHEKLRQTCEICNRTVFDLKEHIKNVHGKLITNSQEGKCQFCEKSFEYSNHLKLHIKDYHQCIMCLTNFKDLRNHYETEHRAKGCEPLINPQSGLPSYF